ncbi:hypothetical protein [Stenotrophomonas indicatrix]|uniref:hypothetical protein n=1 Tax=Stenotrophomonas indicatrix TaxID=2045451 RepID=UPI0034235C3C
MSVRADVAYEENARWSKPFKHNGLSHMKTILELVADRAAADIKRIFAKRWSSRKAVMTVKDMVAYALVGKPFLEAVQHVRTHGEKTYSRPAPFLDVVPFEDVGFNLSVAIEDAFNWLQFELVASGGSLAGASARRRGPSTFLVRTRLDLVRKQDVGDPNKRAFVGMLLATDHALMLGEVELLADLRGSWELRNFEFALASDSDAIGIHVAVDPEDRFHLKKRRRWVAPSVDATGKRASLSHSMTAIYNASYDGRVWAPLLLDEQDSYLESWNR